MGKPQPDLKHLIDRLRELGMSIAFAESCTGGRLAADLTTIPGSSDVVVGSAVCYQLRAKHKVLGLTDVSEKDVVSRETAAKMARAARGLFGSDIAVGTTGLLDGDHPVAFVAIVHPLYENPPFCITLSAGNPRELNREIVVREVMDTLLHLVKELQ